jgi:hypothetical protein
LSKKEIIGRCRICGENKKLTFEHVPPHTTFNDYPVRIFSGEEVIKQVTDPNTLPWDNTKIKGKIQQKGRGDYYLCGDCNSKTGQWYVPHYSRFVYSIHCALQEAKEKEFGSMGVTLTGMRPLPIFKQIMTLFCDINTGLMGDDTLKDYLLDKSATEFNASRYNLYAHIHAGNVERMNGIMALYMKNYGIVTLSEIATYPLGFTLYINKPEEYKPEGVEITSFSNFKYEDECDIKIIIPRLESNIWFSGDYRTKEEIVPEIRLE